MLSMLHMSTLEGRQNAQSLSIFYKILNNLVDVSLPNCIIPSQVQNRDHNNKFIPIQPRIKTSGSESRPRKVELASAHKKKRDDYRKYFTHNNEACKNPYKTTLPH